MTPTKRIVKKPPQTQGEGVTEALRAGLYFAKSDYFDVAESDTSPALLIRIPKNVYVHDVIAHTATLFSTGSSIEIGTDADTDCFQSDSSLQLVGTHSMLGKATSKYSGGYLSTADMDVQVTFSGGAAGKMRLFVLYTPNTEYNYVDNA